MDLRWYMILELQGAPHPSFKSPSFISTKTLVFTNLQEVYDCVDSRPNQHAKRWTAGENVTLGNLLK